MRAAGEVLTKSKFVLQHRTVRGSQLAVDCGASFVRIGINADQIPLTEPYSAKQKISA